MLIQKTNLKFTYNGKPFSVDLMIEFDLIPLNDLGEYADKVAQFEADQFISASLGFSDLEAVKALEATVSHLIDNGTFGKVNK